MDELFKITKLALSIADSSTLKDDEIKLLINAAISDLKRQDIKVFYTENDSLVVAAIVMFVKSKFGNTDLKEKESAQNTYSLLCNNLSLSHEYRMEK